MRLKWKLDLVCLQIVLILGQDTGTVCAKHTIGMKSFGTHPMELLGDVDHVESRFGPVGDSVSVGTRQVHGLRKAYHRRRNHLGRTRWYS